jgi:hypothetical protein
MDEDESLKKYNEWKKTRKEFSVNYADIYRGGDRVVLVVRNGEFPIRVGDWMGGHEVIQIEAYGTDVPVLDRGMTGIITLNGCPSFLVTEDHPEMVEWMKKVREKD